MEEYDWKLTGCDDVSRTLIFQTDVNAGHLGTHQYLKLGHNCTLVDTPNHMCAYLLVIGEGERKHLTLNYGKPKYEIVSRLSNLIAHDGKVILVNMTVVDSIGEVTL